MIDPYTVLGLPHDADADTIRRRYLELVRENPPERAPQKFSEIREAYDHLRDPVVSLESRIFSVELSQTLEDLCEQSRYDVRQKRIATDILYSLAKS